MLCSDSPPHPRPLSPGVPRERGARFGVRLTQGSREYAATLGCGMQPLGVDARTAASTREPWAIDSTASGLFAHHSIVHRVSESRSFTNTRLPATMG